MRSTFLGAPLLGTARANTQRAFVLLAFNVDEALEPDAKEMIPTLAVVALNPLEFVARRPLARIGRARLVLRFFVFLCQEKGTDYRYKSWTGSLSYFANAHS
jgi:hypothetical protein